MADEFSFVTVDETGEPNEFINPIPHDPEPTKPPTPKTARIIKKDPEPKKPGRPKGNVQERELAEFVTMSLQFISIPLMQVDKDGCAQALDDQAEEIGKATAVILMKHPKLVAKLMMASDFGDYAALAMAILPVLLAVKMNHINPAIKKREESNGN